MTIEKEQGYYKSLREAVSLLNSDVETREVLDSVIHGIARAMNAGASLVLLDSNSKKLMHTTSWGLAISYLHKGILDPGKSLGETISGQVVVIDDVQKDSRIQYPDLAAKAGISSILGVPLIIEDKVVGGIRIYKKDPYCFSNIDISFTTTMAKLIAIALYNQRILQLKEDVEQHNGAAENQTSILKQAKKVVFAHPSEQEFARLLDFYNIEWIYEPRSFPLSWESEHVTEMFTPDFYLPDLDLYVELTTLRQSLVTKKNRKLRRLRELNPEVKITLLYKKDFERLLAKYGFGTLAESRSLSIDRILLSTTDIQRRVKELAEQLSRDYADRHPILIGVLRGVICFMSDIIREMTIPLDIEFMAISHFRLSDDSNIKITKDIDIDITGRPVIIIEDIVDTGMTLSYLIKHLKIKEPASVAVCTLLDKRVRRIANVKLEYIGFEVPDEFLVGFGLDYNEQYRNLPFIGILTSEKENEKNREEHTQENQNEKEVK